MKYVKFIVLLLALLAPLPTHAQWANEPSGATVLYDCPLSGNFCNLSDNFYNTFPFTSLSATGQLSPTSALDIAMQANSSTGNGQWVNYYNPALREIYFGTWWSTNSEFAGSENSSNKMFFFRNPAVDNSLISWYGLPGQPKTLVWYFQTTYNECHVAGYSGGCYTGPGTDGTGGLFPNTGSGAATVSAGSGWHRIELYLKSSTTSSSQNGILKMWVDGSLTHNYTNLNLLPLGATEFHINSGWDGSGPFACPGVRDCSKAWHHYVDHLRISTCNGCAVPGGGGTTDTTPPTQVTNLVSVAAGPSSISLSHNPASDNVAIQQYNYEMCTGVGCTVFASAGASNGNVTTFTKSGLQPSTSYSFRNKAVDLSGNVSVQYSNIVTRVTAPPNAGVVTRNTLATDNFDRANSPTLGSAWDWDYYAPSATASPQIVGNVVRAGIATSKESVANYNAIILPQDHWASVVLSTWAADAVFRGAAVQVRAAAVPTPSWYQCNALRNSGDGVTALIEREAGAGVYAVLVSTTSVTWAAGDVLLCEAIGMNPTTINMYRNGTLILTTDDNSSLTGTRAGVQIYTTSLTAVELNNFNEGDFVGTALPLITNVTTDASGADVEWSGGPASIKVTTDRDEITLPIASFPGGRYSRNWAIGITFACFTPIDAQGNANTDSSAYICRQVTPAITDTTPPTRSNAAPSGTLAEGTTSVEISIQTNEHSACKYSTSAGVAYATMTLTLTTSNGLLHSVTVTGLTNGSTYNFYLRCADDAGNPNVSDTHITFGIEAVPSDTTPPTQVVGITGQVLNANQISLSFTLSTDDTAVTNYLVYGCVSSGELGACPFTLMATGTSSPILISGLTPNTTYTFKMLATDAVQNLSTFSDNIELKTPIIDTSPPGVMTGLVAVRTAYDTFQLTWDPGTDDRAVMAAAIEVCAGEECTNYVLKYIATLTTSTTVRGLPSQLPHFFRGKHIDIAGNVSAEYSNIARGEAFPLASGNVQGVCACQIP